MQPKIRSLVFLCGLLAAFGCSRRPRQLYQAGFGQCENAKLGSFGLSLKRSTQYTGYLDLTILTNYAANAGQTVSILLADEALNYVELPPNSPLYDGTPVFQGPVSQVNVETHPVLVIAPRRNTAGPLTSLSQDDEVICKLPTEDNSGTNSNGSVL